MSKKAILVNPKTGMTKTLKVGFSWTTYFFGFITSALRGQWNYAVIQFFFGLVPILGIVLAAKANKSYCEKLLNQGYTPATPEAKSKLLNKGWIVDMNYAQQQVGK